MDVVEIMEACAKKAAKDDGLRKEFLQTRDLPRPLEAFCGICQKLGYQLYPMDLITVGEEYYAAMRRSTNGGGENSPMLEGEDDYYELFLASLEHQDRMAACERTD